MQLADSAPKVEAQLIAEDESVQPGRPFWVALKMNIVPDWHVYWRNPGDSGMATHIAWNLPAGVQVGPIVWPTPQRIEIAPLVNYGFSDQVLLLTQITPPDDLTDSTLQLRAKADWLVCHEVCIPESTTLELDLPVTMDVPLKGAWSSAFTATRKKVPQEFKGNVVVAKKNDQNFTVTLRDLPLSSVETPVEAYFFSGDGSLVTHKMNHEFIQSGRDFTITVPYNTTTVDHPDHIEGDVWVRTTQNDYSFAIDTQFAVPPAPPQQIVTKAPAPAVGIGLFKSFLLAFIGGILLNLMPCVFPVLSIKALGLVQKAQHGDRKDIIVGGLVYTAGVLISFAILGALLLVVKTGGHNVDWGMQLQSPLFVTLMSLALFLIGYTLIGAITFGGNMMGIGQSLTHKAGHVGTFFTGALAVIVATPCTAPFMGGALFYGFTQPWYIAISVLLALGFGLALPYLLICFFPGALRFLPKPGIWMEHFKQFLAFPMFAAAIWLIWVLGQQVGA
ncbi:MAG TPA: protein-disulfide reductase DsbD domain-containing protein, partial [Methylophilus sp.]